MTEPDHLARPFEEHRPHLRAVAYRMLGSPSEADDAVQESWLRLSRTDTSDVENLKAWLTTVVARVCLDMLRSRKARREEPLSAPLSESRESGDGAIDPEENAEEKVLLADSVGVALLVVLETLAPAERVAFVLHDMFDLSFDEIAPIVGRSSTAARQLASRARRRVQGGAAVPDADVDADRARHREIVEAFLAASRQGDFSALLALLDPNVVTRADGATVRAGAEREIRGAAAVAENFKGRARAAQLALVDGVVGAVWMHGGEPRVVFGFTIADDRIVEIELLSDPERLRELVVEVLDV